MQFRPLFVFFLSLWWLLSVIQSWIFTVYSQLRFTECLGGFEAAFYRAICHCSRRFFISLPNTFIIRISCFVTLQKNDMQHTKSIITSSINIRTRKIQIFNLLFALFAWRIFFPVFIVPFCVRPFYHLRYASQNHECMSSFFLYSAVLFCLFTRTRLTIMLYL